MAISSQAFEDGINAYREGKSLTDNPYDVNEDAYTEWVDGFLFQQKKARFLTGLR